MDTKETTRQWAEFLAITDCLESGNDTCKGIADKLGLTGRFAKRTYIIPRVNLARLPEFVQAEFRKITPLRWSKVTKLYLFYSEEYKRHPNGDGPNFSEAWREFIGADRKRFSPFSGITFDDLGIQVSIHRQNRTAGLFDQKTQRTIGSLHRRADGRLCWYGCNGKPCPKAIIDTIGTMI